MQNKQGKTATSPVAVKVDRASWIMFGLSKKLVVFILIFCLSPFSLSLTETESGFTSENNEGVRIFDPAYYIEFDPVTALDLVQRTPGFNPQQQNGGRGLAGVRTNILINGKRLPPKGQSFWQILSNRPYTSVTRIELINTNATLDIDMQGYTQVANIIMEDEDPNYFELNSRYTETGDGDVRQRNESHTELGMIGNMSWGAHDFSLRAGLQDNSTRTPSDFVDIDPANPEQRVASQNQNDQEEKYLQLSSIFNFSDDRNLSVNVNMNERERISAPVIDAGNAGSSSAVRESFLNDRDFREISAEYLQPFGERSDLMFAMVDSRNIEGNASTFAVNQDLLSSLRDRESGETAARLRLTNRYSDNLTLRAIGSSAFNYFEGKLRLFENGQAVSLDGSDSRVEEDRHSLALEADWNWRDNWILRGSLSGGTYALEAENVSNNEQTEVKGRASVAYQLQDRTTITWESRYDIGQLSLSQFLASSNLSSEILQAGAVKLDSESSWEHSLNYDQRFGDRGVFKFTLGHQNRENPIRAVALSDSLIVSQNTYAEKINWFSANVEYPFERFDMEDLILEAGFTARDSQTIDPVTGESREVSGVNPFQYSLGLRKNPGESKWSWGLNIWRNINGRNYGVRETNLWQQSYQWQASLQYEFFQGLRLNARLESPRSERNLAEFYSSVRQPGLNPSFLAATNNRRDSSSRISLQWRRDKYMEITATIFPRPRFQSQELLTAFGETEGTLQAREIAQSPRAELRFRIYNR